MAERVDPLVSTPPAFTDAEAGQILRDGFGLDGALTPLAGERDQNFRVDSPGGRFLLKISNPADERPVLDMQTAALRHIERADPGLPVMRALTATAGEPWVEAAGRDGRTYPARLFTFLPGRPALAAELDTAAIRSFGQVAARLGRALRGFFHPAADYEIQWDLSRAAGLRPLLEHVPGGARRDQVARVLDRFDRRVAPALPGLRAQVIHADLSLGNVLFDDDLRVSAVVDVGDMTHAPLVCDLAVAVADVLHGRADAVEAAEVMIGGYAAVTPLEDDEARLLADLVMARLATDVTVTAWRIALHPGHAGPGDAAEAAAFLDIIDELGPDLVAERFAAASRGLPYRPAATSGLLGRRRRVLPRSPLFYRDPVHLVRGEGVWLFDAGGRRYLDCYNNVPVAGHSHPEVVRAVTAQQRLLATHSRYLHEAVVELAERLTAGLPAGLDAVLVVNSGSEANDLAWRIARAATGRAGAVVTAHAYHGLTGATHAFSPEEWAAGEHPAHVATVPAPDGYRGPYRRDTGGWAGRYAAHIDDAGRRLAGTGGRGPGSGGPGSGGPGSGGGGTGSGGDGRDSTRGAGPGLAAMFADPSFTADGILDPPAGYLREAASRVHAHGGLFVADEVQAGHGRCGSGLWSFAASGAEPDMVVLGKPMGNGFPVAALVARSALLDAIPGRTELFSTFGGNPVACAAALAVLDVIDREGLVANAAGTGGYLTAGLRALAAAHPVVGDVRGSGLLIGVDLVADPATREPAPASLASALADALRDRGVLLGTTGPAGNVLKIRPPLVFRRAHADLLLTALDAALGAFGS